MSASFKTETLLPPPISGFAPATFMERGVAVPFTTPQLSGARARTGAHPGARTALELIVPNPSGGRGVYILPWDRVTALCNPTLHDRRLSAAVSSLRAVTPATMRGAGREIAVEGLAGRQAAVAAGIAGEADHRATLMANFDLLLELVRQVEPGGENPLPPEQDQPARLEQRARRAVARIAPQLGRAPEVIAAGLEQLGKLYSAIGVGRSGRLHAVVSGVGRLREDLAAYAAGPGNEAGEAGQVAGAAGLIIACTQETLTDARNLTADVAGLLRRFLGEPDALAALLARPEWLLDGWDHICALWKSADAHFGRGPALAEIADLVPAVPRETGAWVRETLNIETDLIRYDRHVSALQDWRAHAPGFDVIARNEALLAHLV